MLETAAGPVLVDSGWDDPGSLEALSTGLRDRGLEPGDVARVLVTHAHGDHYGLASHFARENGADISIGEQELEGLNRMIRDRDGLETARYERLERLGAQSLIPALQARGSVPPFDWELPDRLLAGGQELAVGERTLRVIPTPGHTRGHVCFLDADSGLLFSGDHVLPHITPSIGFGASPAESALQHFLISLARVRNLDVQRVLPAHGPVFDDLAGRVDELTAHHRQRLEEAERAVADGGSTPFEVAGLLRWTHGEIPFSTLGPFNRMLATFETLAHLVLLDSQARVRRVSNRPWRFEAADEGDAAVA